MYKQSEENFQKILSSLSQEKSKILLSAYNFSKNAHKSQKRKSGEDYFVHPLQVAINLWNQFHDIDLTIAGLLHDTVEDNENIDILDIYETFGEDVGFMVDAVTKNKSSFHNSDQLFRKKIDKFLYGGEKDIRCFLLKIADRKDNLQTIQNLKENKQVRMAFETQAIFLPLESILNFPNICDISQAKHNYENHIKLHNINKISELKNHLVKKTFQGIGKDSFEQIYQNTHNTIWKIDDVKMLQNFLKIENINDIIDIESIQHTQTRSSIDFRFKQGTIMENDISFTIGDSYSFTKK